MSGSTRRFACTACGKCCNRSPEVELSEAAALADVFVFRLMFRLYSLPRAPERGGKDSAELFYEKKRLLAAHAARAYPKKVMRGGRPVERTHYLMISALALDTRQGACAALEDGRCGVYERRPLGCRTVPFHYSRVEGLALQDFDAFTATPGFACDTGNAAPLVLDGGRIVDEATRKLRADAWSLAERDRRWKEAIVRRMKRGANAALPSIEDVEANAGVGALTTSMRIAWEIAADEGLLEHPNELLELQLQAIDRELATGGAKDVATLREMAAEYRHYLNG